MKFAIAAALLFTAIVGTYSAPRIIQISTSIGGGDGNGGIVDHNGLGKNFKCL